jgi:hypothetical protein
MGVETGVITLCTSKAAVAALTDNTEANELFDAGMNRVFVMPMDDLDLSSDLEGFESDFFSILISSDFDKDDVEPTAASGTVTITNYANLVSGDDDTVTVGATVFTAQESAVTLGQATFRAATSNNDTAASLAAQINGHAVAGALVTAVADGAIVTITSKTTGSSSNSIALEYDDNDTNVGATVSGATLEGGDGLFLGAFKGVTGVSSDDLTFLSTQAAIQRRCAFYGSSTNKAKNMFYAFGKLLSNPLNWLNQQYVAMPYDDSVSNLGDANSLFDSRISFVIADSEFGQRLALFACGGQAIVAPYVIRNLEVDMQSKALTYIAANQPNYTKTRAALLEDELSKVVEDYIRRDWIESGDVEVLLEQSNFIATGNISVSEPKALWRIFGEIRQTS